MGCRIYSKAYKIFKRNNDMLKRNTALTAASHWSSFYRKKGMVLLLNVLCYRCTVKGRLEGPKGKSTKARQSHEHDGSSICHHEGMRTATAKSYSPKGRAGETSGPFVLRALATEHGIQRDS